TYGIIGVKCWVYRGDRLANGDAPGIVTPPGAEEDRRPRRNTRPGAPGAPAGRGGRPGGGGFDRGAPRQAADRPAETSAVPAAPAGDSPKTPAVKRVRKAVAPDAKGE
ncbi:MAG TPA: 30S ribosomal protein S3, partial [Rhizobacter sp.]|nr:30S ribosomal protein S3 [Rhizobacter sp.]